MEINADYPIYTFVVIALTFLALPNMEHLFPDFWTHLKMRQFCVFLVATLVFTTEYLSLITFKVRVNHCGVRSLMLYFWFLR